MNELIFFTHVFLSVALMLGALRFGQTVLVAAICLQEVLANLFVLKQVTLFGLEVTCSDAYAIGSIIGLNLLQEFYGRDRARRAIWIGFFTVASFIVLSSVHLLYAPNAFDWSHAHYASLLTPMPRLMAASLTTFLTVQLIDMRLFTFLRALCAGRFLSLRMLISISCMELLDTIMFSILGLYGTVGSIGEIIVFSFIIKLIAIVVATPCCLFAQRVRGPISAATEQVLRQAPVSAKATPGTQDERGV